MSLATLGIVAQVASTGLGMLSAKAQADATAGIAEHNALVAENDRRTRLREAQARELYIRRRSGEELARQRASLAANGLDVSSGSPLTALQNTLTLAEEDILAERRQGLIDANRLKDEANMSRWEAKRAKKAGKIGMALGFLSGVSNVASSMASTKGTAGAGLFTSRRPVYAGVNRNTWGVH